MFKGNLTMWEILSPSTIVAPFVFRFRMSEKICGGGAVIGRYLHLLRLEEIAGRVQSLGDAHKFLKSLTIKNIDK